MALRLFIGLALDDATRSALERALAANAAALPDGVRCLAPDAWHLTLQFLGAVADAAVPALSAACAETAAACAPFAIELGGGGAFKSARSARVLWIGLARGAEQVAALHHALLVHTEPLGFAREARAFSAHLTVARAKQPFDARAWLDALQLQLPPLAMEVTALTLFRSHLSPRGARYEALQRFALGSGSG